MATLFLIATCFLVCQTLLSCVLVEADSGQNDCTQYRQYFVDPSTHLRHPCSFVCDYHDAKSSPPDCQEKCSELYDCLVGNEDATDASDVEPTEDTEDTEAKKPHDSADIESRQDVESPDSGTVSVLPQKGQKTTVAPDFVGSTTNYTLVYVGFAIALCLLVILSVASAVHCRSRRKHKTARGYDVEMEKQTEAGEMLNGGDHFPCTIDVHGDNDYSAKPGFETTLAGSERKGSSGSSDSGVMT